ncbi:flagellar motor switch protein FliN [Lachnospiraceae bacterium]|nr:flagellar motor switch protein FliN [Ruminococcus sp.]NBI99072.1 flagellar motor switch protein FliN [Lachnospiraceae bacterium]
MSSECFSKMEIDAIGEILNISLGASATAVSTMLNARVDITTPVVNVVKKEEFEMGEVEPAVGVEITYVAGLEGKNVMLLKRHDVKVIVEMVMGMEIADEDFELDEINVSVVCEVMNQMMGSSATALSEFLGKMVNISTPISFEVANEQEFIDKYFVDDQPKVVVGFTLQIAEKLESEFFNVMPMNLAKSLVEGFLPEDAIIDISSLQEEKPAPAPAAPEPAASGGGGTLSQEEIEKMLAGGLSEEPAPAPDPAPAASGGGGTLSQEEIEKMLAGGLGEEPAPAPAPQPAPMAAPAAPSMPAAPADTGAAGMMQGTAGMAPAPQMMQAAVSPDVAMMQMQMMQQMMQQMQQMQQQMTEKAAERAAAAEPKMIHVQSPSQQKLKAENGIVLEGVQEENMELIMSVPLEISVEIGRTRKLVKDILDFTKGSLVVLDKLAGEQVDLFVNGQCIAKGDVVVVEDNFGIRITEIMKVNLAALE